MMLASWYVALKHELPSELPPELLEHRERILFARWLVMTGRVSDFGPFPGPAIGQLAQAVQAKRPRRRAPAAAAAA